MLSSLNLSQEDEKIVVVIGGGIAGVSCVEALYLDYNPRRPQYTSIKLVSKSRLIKKVRNYQSRGRNLEDFDVSEESGDSLIDNTPNGLSFEHIVAEVVEVQSYRAKIIIKTSPDLSQELSYNLLCICTGARPRMISYSDSDRAKEIKDRIIVIRDTHTVNELRQKLASCEKLVIVGNGGISLELVYKISDCEKVWIIRDNSIGASYFDPGAAKFLIESWQAEQGTGSNVRNYHAISEDHDNHHSSIMGPSLGPEWSQDLNPQSNTPVTQSSLKIITDDEVVDIVYRDSKHPLQVETKNGNRFDCDMVISAIGVEPNIVNMTDPKPTIGQMSGYLIDTQMRTTLERVYAAGDVVSCENWPNDRLWFQMRLWTQARQMGYYAGRCIAAHASGQDPSIYFNFDCFTHCTKFFGHKITLIGLYNGQKIGDDAIYEAIVRVNKGRDYVKILLGHDGRIKGAVMIGDSGLEETIENLINDSLDVSSFKERLLDDTVDIDDYFD